MSLIDDRKQELLDEYGVFPDPQSLFEYLIEKNKGVAHLDAAHKNESNLVKGCVSSLWLVPSFEGGKCYFQSDADSLITRAVASVVCHLYSGLTPQEVLSIDPAILSEVNISTHLSPNRRNGLSQLCLRIENFAKSKSNNTEQ